MALTTVKARGGSDQREGEDLALVAPERAAELTHVRLAASATGARTGAAAGGGDAVAPAAAFDLRRNNIPNSKRNSVAAP